MAAANSEAITSSSDSQCWVETQQMSSAWVAPCTRCTMTSAFIIRKQTCERYHSNFDSRYFTLDLWTIKIKCSSLFKGGQNYYIYIHIHFLPQVQSAAAGSAASESHQPHERGCGKGCCICNILSPLQTGTQSGMRWGSVKLQHIIMEFCV